MARASPTVTRLLRRAAQRIAERWRWSHAALPDAQLFLGPFRSRSGEPVVPAPVRRSD